MASSWSVLARGHGFRAVAPIQIPENAKRYLRAALVRINQLEAQTLRPLRDLALGIAGAHDRLAALEAQIAAERARLA